MAMTLITTNTSSNAASSNFTSSIDSTYKLYIFKVLSLNPATDDANFTFLSSTNGGSSYGETMTSSAFAVLHEEDNGENSLFYASGQDLAQGSTQQLMNEMSNAADSGGAATLYLFNPSNTTYVKHWYCRAAYMDNAYDSSAARDLYTAGYVNSTSAVNAVQFKMSSGNFDGTIKMYGVS